MLRLFTNYESLHRLVIAGIITNEKLVTVSPNEYFESQIEHEKSPHDLLVTATQNDERVYQLTDDKPTPNLQKEDFEIDHGQVY